MSSEAQTNTASAAHRPVCRTPTLPPRWTGRGWSGVKTGRDVVEGYCGACHSLDYPRQNVLFLNRQGWETEVTKMIKTYGAPIPPADAKAIVDYLAENYGSGG